LNRWKGQALLIEAFARLPRDRSVHLRLVGSAFPSDRAVFDELVAIAERLGVSGLVSFDGERVDAHELMAQADIVVVPSQRPEPFGLVVVEAMSLGRIVVATEPGGPKEVITNGVDGLLVRIADVDALTNCLESILQYPERAAAIASRAPARAAQFSGSQVAEEYLAHLLRMAPSVRADY
jgi:glycosyltransferase involved in cell wall biosynthesis